MSPVEYEDLPTMSDMCFGGDHCEACQEFNYPKPCPCGEPTDNKGLEP
jgi:hypothetical protein